jgi:membrane protein DedA with SNARE-associated domain
MQKDSKYAKLLNTVDVYFINSVEHFSYIAIFFFCIFSGYIIPLPEEIILLIVGYMASVGLIHLFPAIVVVIFAVILGDNMLYRLTLKNNKHVSKLVNEVLSLKIFIRKRALMERHVGTAIFASRFFPFLRFVGPIFAGYIKADRKTFVFFNTLAIIIYVPLVIFIGYFFNNSFDWAVNQFGRLRHITIIFAWVIIGLLITRIVDYVFRKVNPEN